MSWCFGQTLQVSQRSCAVRGVMGRPGLGNHVLAGWFAYVCLGRKVMLAKLKEVAVLGGEVLTGDTAQQAMWHW